MYAEAELIERLRLICGSDHVLTAAGELAAYTATAADPHPGSGAESLRAVVLPGTASEVVAAVTACAEAQVPYTVRGSGSSHAHSGSRSQDSLAPAAQRRRVARLPLACAPIIFGLARLRRVLAVDQDAATVTAEPGAPVALLNRAVGEGRAVVHELADPRAVTVGGALAAGFGLSSLVALDLLMPNGTTAHLDTNAPGYDLCGAFIGSAGRSGIALRCTLRIASGLRVA